MGKQIPKRFSPLISVLYFAIKHLPVKSASALMAYVLTKGSNVFVKPNNMRSNIREVFPELDKPAVDALSKEMLANFGRHIAEIAHISDFSDGRRGTCIDCSTPEGMTFDGKGPAIYVGGHVGSWELSPLIFKQKNQPITVIYSKNSNPIVDGMLRSQRRLTGASYVEKNKALKPCFHALNRGESIALLVDQRVDPGIDVEFLGQTAAITRLPARLATGFNCPIIPFEVVRIKPGHLRVVLQSPIVPDGRKGKQAEVELTQKVANAVQKSIRRNAEIWFCSKLRWKRVDKERLRDQNFEGAPLKPREEA